MPAALSGRVAPTNASGSNGCRASSRAKGQTGGDTRAAAPSDAAPDVQARARAAAQQGAASAVPECSSHAALPLRAVEAPLGGGGRDYRACRQPRCHWGPCGAFGSRGAQCGRATRLFWRLYGSVMVGSSATSFGGPRAVAQQPRARCLRPLCTTQGAPAARAGAAMATPSSDCPAAVPAKAEDESVPAALFQAASAPSGAPSTSCCVLGRAPLTRRVLQRLPHAS